MHRNRNQTGGPIPPALAMALAVVLSASGSLLAGPTFGLPAGAKQATVPLERYTNLLLVRVRVNGLEPELFVLDTGATWNVVDAEWAKKSRNNLGMEVLASTRMNGTGGTQGGVICRCRHLGMGGVFLDNSLVCTTSLKNLAGVAGLKIRGVIGGAMLRQAPFAIDYCAPSLTFYERSSFQPPPRAHLEELHLIDGCPAVRMSLDDRIEGWFVLDSGSNGDLDLFSQSPLKIIGWKRPRGTTTVLSLGLGGQVAEVYTHVESAKLFGQKLQQPAITYPASDQAEEAMGLVGAIHLDQHRLTLDYAGLKLWVEVPDPLPTKDWLARVKDPHGKDARGSTPLLSAVREGRQDVVQALLSRGADPKTPCADGMTPLLLACAEHRPELVSELLSRGADPNPSRGYLGDTALLQAARWGDAQTVRLLLAAKADVNGANSLGQTPLLVAAEAGNLEVVAALLKVKAKVNCRLEDGSTPLFLAAWRGYADVVKLLLEAGANANVKLDNGATPLHAAAREGQTEVVVLLLDHGANINAKVKEGGSVLTQGVMSDSEDMVRLLLSRGADPQIKDDSGKTAWDYATAQGRLGLVEVLKDWKDSHPPKKIARKR